MFDHDRLVQEDLSASGKERDHASGARGEQAQEFKKRSGLVE
jgi:hypothetical protein